MYLAIYVIYYSTLPQKTLLSTSFQIRPNAVHTNYINWAGATITSDDADQNLRKFRHSEISFKIARYN